MAKIKVVYSGVSEANNRLQKILRETRELSNHIADLQTRIPMEIQSRYQIGEQLHMCCRSAEVLYLQGRKLLDVTQMGMTAYRSTEVRLQRALPKLWGQNYSGGKKSEIDC